MTMLTPEERIQRAGARAQMAAAIREGLLQRQPCERCGDRNTHGHHRWGYDDPFRVAWLCARHHYDEHSSASRAYAGINVFGAMREAIPGLTQREVSRRTGINSGRLSIIERGVPPTDAEAAKLRAVLFAASQVLSKDGSA